MNPSRTQTASKSSTATYTTFHSTATSLTTSFTFSTTTIHSNIRLHLCELDIPEDNFNILQAMHQIHAALKAKLEGHIEAAGHTILPHDDNNVIFDRTKYAHLVGETGSAYYMRRRFPVDTTPNWGFHNEHIMEAFFDKATLRNQGIIMALKCSSEWVHPDARNTT